jgi:hypothetical protein
LPCEPVGILYGANELTRPRNGERAPGLSLTEGFYLDLRNTSRLGDPVLADESTATSYVDYEPGQYIVYWFTYGFNRATVSQFNHEGEWERLLIELSPQNVAERVYYFQHTCNGEGYDWDEMVSEGYLTTGSLDDRVATHPVVYAARGAHASYPEPISINARYIRVHGHGSCEEANSPRTRIEGLGDVAQRGPVTWKTWLHGLVDASSEPWYGFGGAWGDLGTADYNTGPLGPDHKDPSSVTYD